MSEFIERRPNKAGSSDLSTKHPRPDGLLGRVEFLEDTLDFLVDGHVRAVEGKCRTANREHKKLVFSIIIITIINNVFKKTYKT